MKRFLFLLLFSIFCSFNATAQWDEIDWGWDIDQWQNWYDEYWDDGECIDYGTGFCDEQNLDEVDVCGNCDDPVEEEDPFIDPCLDGTGDDCLCFNIGCDEDPDTEIPDPCEENPDDCNGDDGGGSGNNGDDDEDEFKDWYLDVDGDGYHAETLNSDRNPGEGWVEGISDGEDCDDSNKEVHKLNNCGKCEAESKCNDCDTKKEDVKKAFPNISDSNAQKLADVLNNKGKDFGIDTKEKLQHFLAQASHETGGFNKLTSTESTYYSTASRLEQVWPSRFSQTDSSKKDPDDYIKNSSKLANFVYANRMGNGNEASGDGYNYRGRGIFQLTGKSNYQSFTNAYNAKYDPDKDFVANPGLLASDNDIAIISALWYYQNRVLNKITVDGNTSVLSVTYKVNGGDTGVKDRKTQFSKAKNNIDCK